MALFADILLANMNEQQERPTRIIGELQIYEPLNPLYIKRGRDDAYEMYQALLEASLAEGVEHTPDNAAIQRVLYETPATLSMQEQTAYRLGVDQFLRGIDGIMQHLTAAAAGGEAE